MFGFDFIFERHNVRYEYMGIYISKDSSKDSLLLFYRSTRLFGEELVLGAG